MTTPSLDSILPDYANALQRLAEFSHTPTLPGFLEQPKATHEDCAPCVLAVLSQRDRIQKALEADVSIPNGNLLHTLSELDRKLRNQATAIAQPQKHALSVAKALDERSQTMALELERSHSQSQNRLR